jgi:hypothetical protein
MRKKNFHFAVFYKLIGLKGGKILHSSISWLFFIFDTRSNFAKNGDKAKITIDGWVRLDWPREIAEKKLTLKTMKIFGEANKNTCQCNRIVTF